MKKIKVILFSCLLMLIHSNIFAAANLGNVIYNHILQYQSQEMANIITGDILQYSAKYDVDPLLITALFTQESGFNMGAISPTGAIGIAQLQPETAKMIGVYPYDLHQNIEGGIAHFATQQRNCRKYGDWCLTYAIAAYNAGGGAISEYDGVPPYGETENHVERIYNIHRQLVNQMNR